MGLVERRGARLACGRRGTRWTRETQAGGPTHFSTLLMCAADHQIEEVSGSGRQGIFPRVSCVYSLSHSPSGDVRRSLEAKMYAFAMADI